MNTTKTEAALKQTVSQLGEAFGRGIAAAISERGRGRPSAAHPSAALYQRGACRCAECKGLWALRRRIQRLNAKLEVPEVDNRKLHPLGGGPTRCTTLPEGAADRKTFPVASGFMDYFPDAIAAISNLSHKANEQHNAGQPVHWARGKSSDHSDTMVRHFLQRGTIDKDGQRHTVKMAWRALAMLQEEIEAEHTTTATFTSHAQAPNAR